MRTPFLGQFYKSRSKNLDQQRAVNLYLELAEHKQGKQKGMLLMAPGLDPLVTLVGGGGGGGPAPPPGPTELWVAGLSCELFEFPPTANGNPATPIIDITGTTSTLKGPEGNALSLTFGAALDGVGNQYVMQANYQVDNHWTYSIPIFAPGATGDPAPTRNIVGSNTGFPRSTNPLPQGFLFGQETAGICVDAANNIYAGFLFDAVPTSRIWSFPAGSNGNAVGTVIVSVTDFLIQSLAYEASTGFIVAAGNAFSGTEGNELIRIYDTGGALQRTITSSIGINVCGVAVSPNGSIILTGIGPGSNGYAVVFAPLASGAAIPSQIVILTAAGVVPIFVGTMDVSGLLYVGPVPDVGGNSFVQVFAAGVAGTDPVPIRQFHTNLFDTMADSTATNIQQIIVQ